MSIFKRLQAGDTSYLCAELGDFFTHPDYRRQGIFRRRTSAVCEQAQRKGVGLIYVRPDVNSYPGLAKMGFEYIFYLLAMYELINAERVWKKKFSNSLLYRLSLTMRQILYG